MHIRSVVLAQMLPGYAAAELLKSMRQYCDGVKLWYRSLIRPEFHGGYLTRYSPASSPASWWANSEWTSHAYYTQEWRSWAGSK